MTLFLLIVSLSLFLSNHTILSAVVFALAGIYGIFIGPKTEFDKNKTRS